MKDVLDFINLNRTAIIMILVMAMAMMQDIIGKTLERRHQRKLQEDAHRQRLAILKERLRIAETMDDAVKLLVADTALAEDFEKRLAAAIAGAKKERAGTGVRIAPDAVLDEPLEESAPASTVATTTAVEVKRG